MLKERKWKILNAESREVLLKKEQKLEIGLGLGRNKTDCKRTL